MKRIDPHERCLLFSISYFNTYIRIHKASSVLADEAVFYSKLFKRYIINGKYEKARELGECIDNILSCFK